MSTTAAVTSTTTPNDNEDDNINKKQEVSKFNPAPRDQWELISQGAEAKVWKLLSSGEDNNNKNKNNNNDNDNKGDDESNNNNNNNSDEQSNNEKWIVCKERFSKSYRHPDLDERLTKSRCRAEAKILSKCTSKIDKKNLRVPKVVRVEPPLLYIEYINHPTLKDYWRNINEQHKSTTTTTTTAATTTTNNNTNNESSTTINNSYNILAKRMGNLIGHLHNLGIVHGDLTTSNIMIELLQNNNKNDNNNYNNEKERDISSSSASSSSSSNFNTNLNNENYELILIDFGLAKSTTSVEEQAVDLYVLERALLSTHPELPETFFPTFLEAYGSIANISSSLKKKSKQSTLDRLEQVRLRGRKRECFG